MARIEIENYGVAELTKVVARKTGEIEAQMTLNSEIATLENGMVVYIDVVNDEIVNTYSAATCLQSKYLHFSNARRYETGKEGMNNFVYTNSADVLPRLYKLHIGDLFVTNVIDADEDYEGFADVTAGVITSAESSATGDFYIKPTTLPNGELGFSVRVVA